MTTDWNYAVPTTPDEAILVLERRIQVHQKWAEFVEAGGDEAQRCVDAGVGRPESHRAYISQYTAMIAIIRTLAGEASW